MRTPVTFTTHTLDQGGGTRVIATLANLLARSGHPTRVVAVNRSEQPQRDWFDDAVEVRELTGSARGQRLLQLLAAMRHEQGVVFSCCEFSSVSVPWMRSWLRRPPALVIVVHNTLSELLRAEHDKQALRWGMRLGHAAYARADVVAAVSRDAAADVQRALRLSRVQVLHNPIVDSERMQAFEPPCPEWMRDLPRPLVCNVGRLHAQKDQDTLIEAFLRACPTGTLVLLGEGPLRPALEARVAQHGAQSRVRIPGAVDNPLECMYHCDLFALSSRYEGLPTVLVEAMSVGCPVVSTDCPSGPREILDDGRYGTLVPVGDVEAMAAAITATLQAPPDGRRLRERADIYSYDNALRNYEALIESLVART